MKTTIQYVLLILTFTVVFNIQSNARVLTVSNQTFPQVAQYTTLQSAHDAAQDGDTINIYPSLTPYQAITFTKKIIVIGAGFELVTDYSGYSKISGTIVFDSGSESSILYSLVGNFNVQINTNNISVKRCKINQLSIEKNLDNIYIVNCDISSYLETQIYIGDHTIVCIFNNIFRRTLGCFKIHAGIGSSAIIRNNLFMQSFDAGYGLGYPFVDFRNSSDLIIQNNIYEETHGGWDLLSAGTLFQNTNGYNNNDVNNHFVDYMNDNYHLIDGSSFKASGTDGKDLGIYGGDYPFVDDGAPSLPTIYFLKIPSTASQIDELSVEIKAKANN
jgi:hypothetical protein